VSNSIFRMINWVSRSWLCKSGSSLSNVKYNIMGWPWECSFPHLVHFSNLRRTAEKRLRLYKNKTRDFVWKLKYFLLNRIIGQNSSDLDNCSIFRIRIERRRNENCSLLCEITEYFQFLTCNSPIADYADYADYATVMSFRTL